VFSLSPAGLKNRNNNSHSKTFLLLKYIRKTLSDFNLHRKEGGVGVGNLFENQFEIFLNFNRFFKMVLLS